jgi:hypothetical protein
MAEPLEPLDHLTVIEHLARSSGQSFIADEIVKVMEALQPTSERERIVAALWEPTDAMFEAYEAVCIFGSEDDRSQHRESLKEAWQTMLSAALRESGDVG